MINHLIAVANLPRKQKGLTSVEYIVAGGLIVAALAVGFLAFGTELKLLLADLI